MSLGLRGLGRGCVMVRMPAGKALMVLSAVLEGEGGAHLGGITTTKIIYDVTIYGVTFKIMTPLNLKFIKVTHHIKNLQLG